MEGYRHIYRTKKHKKQSNLTLLINQSKDATCHSMSSKDFFAPHLWHRLLGWKTLNGGNILCTSRPLSYLDESRSKGQLIRVFSSSKDFHCLSVLRPPSGTRSLFSIWLGTHRDQQPPYSPSRWMSHKAYQPWVHRDKCPVKVQTGGYVRSRYWWIVDPHLNTCILTNRWPYQQVGMMGPTILYIVSTHISWK